MQGHLIGSVCPFFSLNSGSEKKVFHFKEVDTSNGASKSKLLMVLEVWGQAKGKMPRKKGLNLNSSLWFTNFEAISFDNLD